MLAGDPGELERALDHAARRVAVAVHDPVAQRAVIRPDAQRAAELLAEQHERCELLVDPRQLLGILVVRVFLDLKFLLVRVIAGVDPDLLDPLGRFHRRVRLEVDVRDNRDVAAARVQPFDDVLQVGGVLHRRCGDAHDLAADLDQLERLLDGQLGVHRVAGEHGLLHGGMVTADDHAALGGVAHDNFAGNPAMKGIRRLAITHGRDRESGLRRG